MDYLKCWNPTITLRKISEDSSSECVKSIRFRVSLRPSKRRLSDAIISPQTHDYPIEVYKEEMSKDASPQFNSTIPISSWIAVKVWMCGHLTETCTRNPDVKLVHFGSLPKTAGIGWAVIPPTRHG